MVKILFPSLLAASLRAGLYRSEDDASGGETSKGRNIQMDDGRTITFGEKQRIRKDYSAKGNNISCVIDFDNGKTIEVLMPLGNLAEIAAGGGEDAALAQVTINLAGHGLSQKLGDAAAGAESTDDAFEAILEVAARLNKGEWTKAKGEGGGSAKGSSELVQALVKVLGHPLDTIRQMMANLSAGEKMGLRRLPQVAAEIEAIRAARAPSKKDQAKVNEAASLLDALKAGTIPAPKTTAEEPAPY